MACSLRRAISHCRPRGQDSKKGLLLTQPDRYRRHTILIVEYVKLFEVVLFGMRSIRWGRKRLGVCRMASGRVQQGGGLGGSGGGQIPSCHFANIFVYSGSQSGLASRFSCSWPRSRVDQQRSSEAGTRPTGSFTSQQARHCLQGVRRLRCCLPRKRPLHEQCRPLTASAASNQSQQQDALSSRLPPCQELPLGFDQLLLTIP